MEKIVELIKYFVLSVFGTALVVLLLPLLLKLPYGNKLMVVQTGSMEPAIPTGSIISSGNSVDIVSPIPSAKFSVGDIITFSTGKNIFVSHRVVKVVNKDGGFFYQTKGDNNNSADNNMIEENKVIGKVENTLPYLGRLVVFAKKPAGYLMLVVIPCLYVIGTEIFGIVNELKKKESSLAAL
ncbi:signal peptidase I [Candidatus Woesebacteria bacterium RIFCSPHIGHO2_02_FULL_38_9]|uniref:Signal peptidase I n=1 Tax=Candidatus Woesebacteria bacterium RIFCSPHIGHO2_01_FULL_39_28 TaxID=1802496 RepID=A0A1F7YBH1_9BACT|nr:MAG: signal peptidase I [Candidatus Woesebacteria bacterium RIFCSPHIGHO2_01_FULL_39_28]OGM31574.1 MAG: signal peptidase I [Candidatus Woesebacteria bacterium RIFCSPHIGHO2_02_FULL_38_9]OGM58404.1 MAG: signal peptidase I [Candidatus Woesebacteria bacterium RIFCSPLOWO2_01_FULL_38_20]